MALGGHREEINQLENLTLDDYAESLKQARRLGGLTGFASGSSAAGDAAAQGSMRLFENIIGAMLPEEKTDLSKFGEEQRRRVASSVSCSLQQVDDCVARYLWMRSMMQKMAEMKKEGREMPKSIDELEIILGSWRQYKTDHGTSASNSNSSGTASIGSSNKVPIDAVGPRGMPCPFAGMAVGKSAKCPATKKSFKNCCGKKI